ncbi:MAG: hypothetical protein N2Z81_07720 [Hydrogenothermaceae bacterium]|nr:hypothetical protein [Hydrogenothermaceae bacterium]
MKKLLKNPVFITVLLTSFMGLPFVALMFDKFLLKLESPMIFMAEMSIITLGITSAVIILYFIFK